VCPYVALRGPTAKIHTLITLGISIRTKPLVFRSRTVFPVGSIPIARSLDLYPIATGNIGALEGYWPGLANADGRSIVESCLMDM
jgi:hypothetical protein